MIAALPRWVRGLSTLLLLLFLGSAIQAQERTITGKITDQKGEAVPYANVALVLLDGALVDGAVSDENGSFQIESTKTAKVKLVVSLVRDTRQSTEVADAPCAWQASTPSW